MTDKDKLQIVKDVIKRICAEDGTANDAYDIAISIIAYAWRQDESDINSSVFCELMRDSLMDACKTKSQSE